MKGLLTLAVVSLVVVAACKKEDESYAKKAGSAVAETLSDFASGVGTEIDTRMTVDVELAAALTEQGISKTVAKGVGFQDIDKGKGISVYFIAQKEFKSTLVARALNKEGQEIGRAAADVDLGADDAAYVTFTFPSEMDTQLVQKYVIDIKK